ncbi:MAG: 16S rRNA (cytosine(1402)-N(4))-methyltransferase RsmH [Anaerolineales bacterium]|nr:16S rRNA (cytosine(1402)-N(4))-methyltransferase RsmH [Anaerolineales bacterium]
MGDPQAEFTHVPVLYQEVLAALQPRDGGRYVDGTLGLGGHAAGILTASAPGGQLLGLDVDAQALARAAQRLAAFAGRAHLRHSSYAELPQRLSELGWDDVDGILLDLGSSSLQFDNAERGFSFQQQGPLDMRFNPQAALTAADVVNDWSEAELADVLFHYGEERQARKLARAIVRARPLHTTTQLAELIAAALGGKRSGVHPATRSFQALRIAVNGELQTIEHSLPQALTALRVGGRLAVISFHSLEDRLVKQFMRQESRDCICPAGQPSCTCGHQASLKEISRKPVRPSDAEVTSNPRARSARLRVAEKL